MPSTDASPARPHRPTPPPWRLRLLGGLALSDPAGSPVHIPWRAAALLLARVALAPTRSHPREELIELLWPGASLEVGRNRLRQALASLKTGLAEASAAPVILADRSAVRLAPAALQCDAVEFERQLRSGEWEMAESLYQGELLPGHYDEWVLEERGRLGLLAERLHAMPRVPVPKPRAPAPVAGQLPAYWTRLFGIDDRLHALRQMVRRQRLVSVIGAGGSGKTRLAVEAARGLLEEGRSRVPGDAGGAVFAAVCFVSLVDRTSPAQALDAMAAAVQATGNDTLAALRTALAGPPVLLVLDNFEQLVGLAEDIVLRLLSEVPTLHVLITTRLRIQAPGGQDFELSGLPLAAASDGPGHAGDNAAQALFIDRARLVAPRFDAGHGAARAAVAELVRLLAGMPLAIELAASRMRSLTPAELLATLMAGERPMLDMLDHDGGEAAERSGSDDSGLSKRHASMRHVIDWSWRQLDASLVPPMHALAVFLDTAPAEGVAWVAGLDVATARERLEMLRDHSLLLAQREGEGPARYRMLQPVREFVAEHTAPAALPALRQRLRQWLIDVGQRQAARGLDGMGAIEAELPQVYAAILGAEGDGPDAQRQAVGLAVALRRYWEIDTRAGLPLSVIDALQRILPAVQDAGLRCECSILLSFSCVLAGRSEQAIAHSEESIALATEPRQRAHALLRKAQVVLFSGTDSSSVDAMLAEAIVQAQQAADLEAQALALRMQFLVAINRDDDTPRAEALATQVQALWEQLGHRRNAFSGLMDRASCWLRRGRLDEAFTALAACEQASLRDGYATGHIMASWQLGRAALKLRQGDAALAAFRRCLDASWELKRLAYVADALVQLPGGLAATGQLEDAARLLGFAVPHWQSRFGSMYRELARDVTRVRRWLRFRLGPVQMEILRLEGACLNLAQALALGLGQDRQPKN